MAVILVSSLHHCPPMDIPEPLPRSHHHHFLSPPPPPPFLITYLNGFLSSYTCHRPPHDYMSKLALCMGNHNTRTTASAMSASNGKSTMTFRGYSEVEWIVEAEIAKGQCLYITGDPVELGCWKPELAIPMTLSQEANIWKVEVKIPSGMNCKYNYLVKGKSSVANDVIWRQGPQFSLLVPRYCEQDRKIMVRDSWIEVGSRSGRFSTHMWGSWIEEGYFPVEPSGSSPIRGDEHGIVKLLEAKPVLSDGKSDQINSGIENIVSLACEGYASDTISTERKQPVEEPWLITSLFPPLFADIDFHAMEEDEVARTDSQNHHSEMTETLAEEGKDLLKAKDSVSTVILINSSICTMQRIAVLEDDKLVELLLEPVKSNVQCDSVYLGIVTKLVPHMGGAFVNIGSSRHSLMDIKQNQEPFIFPPFGQGLRRQEVDSSATGFDEGHSDVSEDEHTLHEDAEVVDDVAEVFSQESLEKHRNYDYEGNEDEDDFEVPEAPKGSLNGSLIGFASTDYGDRDNSGGTKNHNDGEPCNCFTPMMNNNSSQMCHLQVAKDFMHSSSSENQWSKVRKGTKIIVQVVKEGLGTKGPTLTAYPKLRSRFWVLLTQCARIGISKKIVGVERTRLKVIAKTLQPQGFGLTVRTVAAGHSLEELQKDLEGLLSTWKNIIEHAKSAALAADEGVEGAVPVIVHRAMGQTLSVVQDYFNDKVKKMVVDSPRNYHEVTSYLQEIAPDLCDRVELYDKRNPLFDEYNIEAEIDNILSKRIPLANGGSLVIEQTEALVSIDVNGGHGMFREGNSQEKAILDVNLAAAIQIAREIRLRDIGGIIVVDFIDMADESNKRLVYEEVKKAVERDRSMVKVSELSKYGLMEITRKRVRPSVTFMISEPCSCCHATGRVEALETSFLKIEQEICRMLASMETKADPEDPKSWPRFVLRVDHHMCEYLTSGKKTRIATLSSSLKVWILLKVARGFVRGEFEVKPFSNGNKTDKNHKQVVIPILRPREGRSKDRGKKVTVFPVKKWKTSG